jgi:hypothetical protein
MIRAAWEQARTEGQRPYAIRFMIGAEGPEMVARIGDEPWRHDGFDLDPAELEQPLDDDIWPSP